MIGFRCECGPAIDCTYPNCNEGVEMTEKIKPARFRIGGTSTHIRPQRYANRDPFPQLPFEHELMEPPPMRHVVQFIIGVGIIYAVLIVLATRYFGWMP